jgi:diacylglycerol kinase (ATP)
LHPGGFSLRDRARSFGHARSGLLALVREEHNAWIHGVATIVVVVAGLGFGVSRLEWCALVVAIAIVWCAEALNTALEHLADAVVPEPHPQIGRAKDVAAGAVLVCAVGAAVIGLLVFGPHVGAMWVALRGSP